MRVVRCRIHAVAIAGISGAGFPCAKNSRSPTPPASKETLRHNRKRTGLPSLSPSGVAATCWPAHVRFPSLQHRRNPGEIPGAQFWQRPSAQTPHPGELNRRISQRRGWPVPAIEAPAGKERRLLRIRSRRTPEVSSEHPSEGQHPRRRKRQRERQNSRSRGQSLHCPRNGGSAGFDHAPEQRTPSPAGRSPLPHRKSRASMTAAPCAPEKTKLSRGQMVT